MDFITSIIYSIVYGEIYFFLQIKNTVRHVAPVMQTVIHLEYANSVWCPYKKGDIEDIEKVQKELQS